MPRETLEINNRMDLCDFITYFSLNFQFRDLHKMNKDMRTSSYENDDGLSKDLKSCYLLFFYFSTLCCFVGHPLLLCCLCKNKIKK